MNEAMIASLVDALRREETRGKEDQTKDERWGEDDESALLLTLCTVEDSELI